MPVTPGRSRWTPRTSGTERPARYWAGTEEIEHLAALSGQPWLDQRRQVRDVHGLADGRVPACLEEVLAEAWLPDGRLDWSVPDDQGGRHLVVRRSPPDGAPRWEFTADHPVTAIDGNEETVYVAFNSGELVVLDAADGTVRRRHRLLVDGQNVVPLSLELTAPDRLLIGTADGRILDCRTNGRN